MRVTIVIEKSENTIHEFTLDAQRIYYNSKSREIVLKNASSVSNSLKDTFDLIVDAVRVKRLEVG